MRTFKQKIKTVLYKEKHTIFVFFVFIGICLTLLLSSWITLQLDKRNDVIEYGIKDRILKIQNWDKTIVAQYFGKFIVTEKQDSHIKIEFYRNGEKHCWYIMFAGDVIIEDLPEEVDNMKREQNGISNTNFD